MYEKSPRGPSPSSPEHQPKVMFNNPTFGQKVVSRSDIRNTRENNGLIKTSFPMSHRISKRYFWDLKVRSRSDIRNTRRIPKSVDLSFQKTLKDIRHTDGALQYRKTYSNRILVLGLGQSTNIRNTRSIPILSDLFVKRSFKRHNTLGYSDPRPLRFPGFQRFSFSQKL